LNCKSYDVCTYLNKVEREGEGMRGREREKKRERRVTQWQDFVGRE
jgi:hypothetical protein